MEDYEEEEHGRCVFCDGDGCEICLRDELDRHAFAEAPLDTEVEW